MPALVTCYRCGKPLPKGAICPVCGPSRRQMSTSERGYGADHRCLRLILLSEAIGQPCPLCGKIM
jgi:hypothetical protein